MNNASGSKRTRASKGEEKVKKEYPIPVGFHQYAVGNVRRAIDIDGEKYATYLAHANAPYLTISVEQIMAEAKALPPFTGSDGHG